jgi:hypothetical protein
VKKKKVKRVKKEKAPLVPLPEGISLGDLILYYSDGWRAGHIIETKGRTVGIRAVPAYKSVVIERLVWVQVEDIKLIKGKDEGQIGNENRKINDSRNDKKRKKNLL